MKLRLGAGRGEWEAFRRRYLAEMARPDAKHDLALLAALSHRTDFRWAATARTSPAATAPS